MEKIWYNYTKNIKQNHFNYLSDFYSLIFKVVWIRSHDTMKNKIVPMNNLHILTFSEYLLQ